MFGKTCAYGPNAAALSLFPSLTSKCLWTRTPCDAKSKCLWHFDIASHEVLVSELSPCRSKVTSSVKNISDIGSEHVPNAHYLGVPAWRRVQLPMLPEETVEDWGISGNLRNQAADCEAQLLRLIDGSSGFDATAAWAEYATGPVGGVATCKPSGRLAALRRPDQGVRTFCGSPPYRYTLVQRCNGSLRPARSVPCRLWWHWWRWRRLNCGTKMTTSCSGEPQPRLNSKSRLGGRGGP